ncbi:hypothetical protein, partial [Enterobacter intestinihominis]
AAPPGVKAGSVVRSGALTPALTQKDRGAKQKTGHRFPFFFLYRYSFKPKKMKNTNTGCCVLLKNDAAAESTAV